MFTSNAAGLSGSVLELPKGGAPMTLLSPVEDPNGVVADPAGDVFVGFSGFGPIGEIPKGGTETNLPWPTSGPNGTVDEPQDLVSVDYAGDVRESTVGTVYEVPKMWHRLGPI